MPCLPVSLPHLPFAESVSVPYLLSRLVGWNHLVGCYNCVISAFIFYVMTIKQNYGIWFNDFALADFQAPDCVYDFILLHDNLEFLLFF